MRYGRQRWKLRGRIEINAKQLWDSEDMVFVPLISEFLSVKVSSSECFCMNDSVFTFILICQGKQCGLEDYSW